MDNSEIKCSLNAHQEINAVIYCPKCNIYMCNKCQNHHSELFKIHLTLNLDKNEKEIFTNICKEDNHEKKLEFFCKTHNVLCCVACISKIKNNIYGQHTDCEIHSIEDIKDEKKSNLKNNIDNLENLSNSVEELVNDLKKHFDKINENGENVKLKIQSIFTKIRNAINDREDELLLEVDNQLKKLFCDIDFVKRAEKLPHEIKKSLKRGKETDKNWDNNYLNFSINNCIQIENNINEINSIQTKIKKMNELYNLEVKFSPPNEYRIYNILEIIKNFGKVYNNNFKYSFIKLSPVNINDKKQLYPQIDLKGPIIEPPGIGVNIKGPRIDVDIKGPKIPGIGIDIKGPKIPEIDIKGPKIPGIDIYGPKIDVDIKGPKIPGIGVDIKGPKMPGIDIYGPKIDVDIKGPKIPGIGVDIKGPKMPGIDIYGPKIDIDIKGPKIPGIGVDIKGPKISDLVKKGAKILNQALGDKSPKIEIFFDNKRYYSVSGEKDNIVTKKGEYSNDSNWIGCLCENELNKLTENIWKIKILKTQNKCIMVGVAPIDFDINSSLYDYGWYFHCYNSTLFSGAPQNYFNKETNLSKVNDEITIIMDMKKRTIKFLINNEDKGESYTDIPNDKPLAPVVLLYHTNDQVEIIEC